MSEFIRFPGYEEFLGDLKQRIQTAQVRASLSVNRELVLLYWQIGEEVTVKQQQHGWGDKVLERLAADLKTAFPGIEGFSRRSLYRMRAFYLAYRDRPEFVSQAATQIPWFHNVVIIESVKDPAAREFYIRATLENGWSRNVLVHQIESDLYGRQGKAITNFERTLPPPQSDLAHEILKSPYNFDFLTLGSDAQERDLESGLLEHIRTFLLELGAGFAFLGSQYHIEFDGEDYYLDLLFYHVKLRCYVVIDLKIGKFQPEYAGKMNFYLAVIDDLLRHPDDAPSIGLILCKTKKRLTVEYALRNTSTPIGVSEYQLVAALPAELKNNLPTIEQLEAELGNFEDGID
jgi:predicted nuclease of restriction endonuclease-like (RecB) superfamily